MGVIAHVCEPPATTSTAPDGSPCTAAATESLAPAPVRPNWLLLFRPKHCTAPVDNLMHVCVSPAVTAATLPLIVTARGVASDVVASA